MRSTLSFLHLSVLMILLSTATVEAAPYLILYDSDSLAAASQGELFSRQSTIEEFPHLRGAVLDLSSGEAAALQRSHPGLALISADFPLYASEFIEPENPGLSAAWSRNHSELLTAAIEKSGADFNSLYVAVLDSGIDTHPDFQDRILYPLGRNCLDEADGEGANGDDLTDLCDLLGHGTAVAGVITGSKTGAASKVKIIPIRIANAVGKADFRDMAEAVNHLIGLLPKLDPKARVIVNLSYNSATPQLAFSDAADKAFRAILDCAGRHGLLFIASAGNQSCNIDSRYVYPTSLTDPAFLSVAAVESSGALASFSNYGGRSVEIAAPGRAILTTAREGGYTTKSGTSFSAPYASAVAALAWALYPDLEAWEIRNLLINASSTGQTCLAIMAERALEPDVIASESFVAKAIGSEPILGSETSPGADSDGEALSGGGGGCSLSSFSCGGLILLLLPLVIVKNR
ncbi:MAG: S8 family serine peptidase [Synergistales bacterium]|nr:S8 family serine peptidase [Synergistales bacterium]